MRTFNHEKVTIDNIIAAKKTFKQHQNDDKAIRDIQTIIEDTKIAIDNIKEALSNGKLIQQVWLRISNADTSFGDEILGTKEQGNNGSRYRPYLALDGKNIIEIRIADHYETKKTCLDKSNNKVQYLFQVVLITEPPKPESDISIKTNQSVGNVKVLTNDIVSQDTELDAVVTLFQKISNFLKAPSETYNEIVNNTQLNCNKQMNKKNRIRLTESELHNIIKKCVNEAIEENNGFMDGMKGAWNGFKGGFGHGSAMQGIKKGYQQGAQSQQQTLDKLHQDEIKHFGVYIQQLAAFLNSAQNAYNQGNMEKLEDYLESIQSRSESMIYWLQGMNASDGIDYRRDCGF